MAWQAVGERRRRYAAAESRAWLQLTLDTDVKLTCQRCLGPVETPLKVERWFQFVAGEEQAAQLDADSEEDVLASTRSLDLHQLAEDELLLALPLVPRHEVCPQPLQPAAAHDSAGLERRRIRSPRWPRSSARRTDTALRGALAAGEHSGRGAAPNATIHGFSPGLVLRRWPSSTVTSTGRTVPLRDRAAPAARADQGETHGRSTKQEVALQARHAPLAQRAADARAPPSSRPPASRTCATTSARPASIAGARSSRPRQTPERARRTPAGVAVSRGRTLAPRCLAAARLLTPAPSDPVRA